jgi:hypothetical protein
MQFIYLEMAKETKAVLTYSPSNIRLSKNSEQFAPLQLTKEEKIQPPLMYEPEGVMHRYPRLE